MSLRDRLFSKKTASAVMSPWRLGLTVVAFVAALLLHAPIWLAIITAASFWLITIGLAIPRGVRVPPIDSFTLSEPWRRYVMSAQKAQARYRQTLALTPAGPLKDRLVEIGTRLDEGVQDCWAIAKDGDQIDSTLGRLRAGEVAANLKRLQAQQETAPTDTTAATIAALQDQLAAADRLRARSTESAERLRLAQVRLDQLVTTAAEVAAGAGDTEVLGSGIEDVVVELEALRQAVAEVNRPADPPPTPQAMPGT